MMRTVRHVGAAAIAFTLAAAFPTGAVTASGDAALTLRMKTTGTPPQTLTLDLQRWSSDEERAQMASALNAPPAAEAAGRGAGGRGRAGAAAGPRGGRGRGGAAAPASPAARLASAIKAAPTLGYLWTSGVTGYSVRYAWRSSAGGRTGRLVLITDRRLDIGAAPVPAGPPAGSAPSAGVPVDTADFTVIEVRFDRNGAGDGRTSLTTGAILDQTAGTIAVQNYDAVPLQVRITP